MKLIPFLLLIIFSSKLFSQALDERANYTMNDYWEETKLDFEKIVFGTFTQKNCTRNTMNLIGCVAALNKMQWLQTPDKKSLTKINLETKLFETTDHTNLSKEEFTKLYESYLKELSLELEKSKMSLSLMPFKIESEIKKFQKKYVTAQNDSMTAANLYNEFLRIAVDPHTYIIPKNYNEDRSRPSQDKKGMGIYFNLTKHESIEKYMITDVIRNSPAEKSGLKKGDIILNANATTTSDEVLEVIKNQDPVNLKVIRGNEIHEIKITKGIYTISQVEASLLHRNGKKYGYIKLRSFSDRTACQKIGNLAKSMIIRENIAGFILDLRNNGGGLVSQAQCIMGMYLEEGSQSWAVKYLQDNDNTLVTQPLRGGEQIFKNLHTVTLINGYSASASEALSMYLQDYRKSFIVGERSFGKGSMQTVTEDRENNTVLNGSTVALYYGPKGISPQLRGVIPDIESLPKIDQKEETPYVREEDEYTFPLKDKDIDLSLYKDSERVQEVKTMNTCVESEGNKSFYYSRLGDSEKILFDNQMETAVDVIDCANNYIPHYSGIELKRVEDYDYVDYFQYTLSQLSLELKPLHIKPIEIKPILLPSLP